MADFTIPTVNLDEKAIFKKQHAEIVKKIEREGEAQLEKTVQKNCFTTRI